jgi:hypothetical protein
MLHVFRTPETSSAGVITTIPVRKDLALPNAAEEFHSPPVLAGKKRAANSR